LLLLVIIAIASSPAAHVVDTIFNRSDCTIHALSDFAFVCQPEATETSVVSLQVIIANV